MDQAAVCTPGESISQPDSIIEILGTGDGIQSVVA
jgi:hypothetical protein